MYYNSDIDWIKFCRQKRLFIFGAGKNGQKLLRKLNTEGGMNVAGVIDNDENVAHSRYVADTFGKGYTMTEYKDIQTSNDFIILSTAITEISEQLMREHIYFFIDQFRLDFSGNGESYYDADYFEMQLDFAKVDSVLDVDFFSHFIKKSDRIAEFGSGAGLLLDKLDCAEKIGVEINPVARAYAEKTGIMSVENLSMLDDDSFDVIISTHALEHCLNPYQILLSVRNKLRDGGRAVFVVPHDSLRDEYDRGDLAHHLYTWNQRDFGNLFKMSGFFVREVGMREVAWPREWKRMFSSDMKDWFNAISTLQSEQTGYFSIYAVGEK